MADWLDADQVLERLGIRPQTLYAYVSRGRIEAATHPQDPRRSLYRASDVAALAQRKARGRRAADVAAEAIAWGEPVLPSAITTVAGGRLWYRGQNAAELAKAASLEEVARLLRGGHGAALKSVRRAEPPPADSARGRLFLTLAGRAGREPPARGRAPLALAMEAADLLEAVVDAATGQTGEGLAHARFAAAWGLDAAGADLVRRTLVLLADHELNASTFAARVAASTGASLSAACLAGLSALSGPLHGGMAARVEAFVEEAERRDPSHAVAARLARGASMPGFDHPLYPDGDPRAAALLGAFEAPPLLADLRTATETATSLSPNIDFALVSLARTLKLPPDAPFILFATARSAGWAAHAIEQLQTGRLIRPRARYVGEAPPT
ncbi:MULTISPECIES: citrate synthase family protein [unclassified Caulobacter]|uniref:citrate synthase family protein n=1 Tax=unclassified Caulobacter TaxID=2648921 RepID=UPI0007022BF0|nr:MULTISPECIES: citrate synthase family protein [unclassified Caulobacter]KQV62064.1 citrate synthase [Caulobacter sp. Root342]KQV64724.1 citrate synthase [Caulobacter sp. Root343]